MSRLTLHTLDTAPAEAQERLKNAVSLNGFLPNLLGVLANAPTALETYQTVGAINMRTSLTPTEREIVQITAAKTNGCGFCLAGHTKISLDKFKLDPELVEAIRQLAPLEDKKLNTLAQFTLAVMHNKGHVSDADLSEFFAAGYNDQQAVEVILGISLASLCNYTNNLAKTLINPELQAYA